MSLRKDLTDTPTEERRMRQIGRYQLRVRTLFFAPVVVGLSWWLAVQILDLPDFQVLVEFHEANVSHYQRIAQSQSRST